MRSVAVAVGQSWSVNKHLPAARSREHHKWFVLVLFSSLASFQKNTKILSRAADAVPYLHLSAFLFPRVCNMDVRTRSVCLRVCGSQARGRSEVERLGRRLRDEESKAAAAAAKLKTLEQRARFLETGAAAARQRAEAGARTVCICVCASWRDRRRDRCIDEIHGGEREKEMEDEGGPRGCVLRVGGRRKTRARYFDTAFFSFFFLLCGAARC